MKPVDWTADQSQALLSALRAVATLNGTVDLAPAEQELLEGVRRIILRHPELSEDAARTFPQPPDLARAIEDPEHRRRAAEALALMPYAQRPYDNDKLHISDRFVEALGEDLHRMEAFLGARAKHSRHLEYCTLRRHRHRIATHGRAHPHPGCLPARGAAGVDSRLDGVGAATGRSRLRSRDPVRRHLRIHRLD